MTITDEKGNKLPQSKLSKKEKSRQERAKVANTKNHCKCGFHKRGDKHNEGSQHRRWWNSLGHELQEANPGLKPK